MNVKEKQVGSFLTSSGVDLDVSTYTNETISIGHDDTSHGGIIFMGTEDAECLIELLQKAIAQARAADY